MTNIKILVMDVDGTLTDGKIYMGQDGEILKAFDIKDGCGIFLLLPELDIIPVIITARESRILVNRCKELNISEIHQGSKDKLKTLNQILDKYGVGLDSVAYVGDDIPDLPCMQVIQKAGGVVLCPADAIPEIKEIADYISALNAGNGAIRDCINYLVQMKDKKNHNERIRKAVDLILSGDFEDIPEGILPDGNRYTIQEYITKAEKECVIETHRKHIDIQYILEGTEVFKTYSTNSLTSTGVYNSEKDSEYWQGGIISSCSLLVPESLIIVYNGQPHKGAISFGKPEKIRKLVCKIEI